MRLCLPKAFHGRERTSLGCDHCLVPVTKRLLVYSILSSEPQNTSGTSQKNARHQIFVSSSKQLQEGSLLRTTLLRNPRLKRLCMFCKTHERSFVIPVNRGLFLEVRSKPQCILPASYEGTIKQHMTNAPPTSVSPQVCKCKPSRNFANSLTLN